MVSIGVEHFELKILSEFKINQSTDFETRALFSSVKKLGHWMGGWMDGWVDGWMDGKAGLRIAYSNQK